MRWLILALLGAAAFIYGHVIESTLLCQLAKPWPVLGAALFVVSDSLIGINRFVSPFPEARYLIILTYWLGQWGIAASAMYRNR